MRRHLKQASGSAYLKHLHGIDEGLGDACQQRDAGKAPRQHELQRCGPGGVCSCILHDRPHAPEGLPLAATSAAIWLARYGGLIAVILREIRSATQFRNTCETVVSACDSVFMAASWV